jgi:flagellar hook-associated protein 3 FlgL
MLRFSLLGSFNQSVNRILTLQSETVRTQNQVSLGRKILVPSDDPVSAARIIQLNQEQSQVDQYLNNMTNANNRLGLEETQINEVQNILFRLKEITVNAGNGTLGQSERKGLAAEVSSRLDQLVDLANTRDASGEYIFAGFQGSAKPFVDVGSGNYVYQGDEGQRTVSIATTTKVAISDSGSDIFENIDAAQKSFFSRPNLANTGGATISPGLVTDQTLYDSFYPEDYSITFAVPANTYSVTQKSNGAVVAGPTGYTPGQPIDIDLTATRGFKLTITGSPANTDNFQIESTPKQSLLTTIGRLYEGLQSITDSTLDKPVLDALIADTLTNLDFAETRTSEIRSKIGARFNVIEGIQELQEGIKLINAEVLSKIRDLDYAEALSRLSQQTFSLEASQQSYAKISNLSLFNFLR